MRSHMHVQCGREQAGLVYGTGTAAYEMGDEAGKHQGAVYEMRREGAAAGV